MFSALHFRMTCFFLMIFFLPFVCPTSCGRRGVFETFLSHFLPRGTNRLMCLSMNISGLTLYLSILLLSCTF